MLSTVDDAAAIGRRRRREGLVTTTININAYSDALVVLGTAGVSWCRSSAIGASIPC